MVDARPSRRIEAFAAACLGTQADDCRLGDLSEQYVRTCRQWQEHRGAVPAATIGARAVSDVRYVASTINVTLFARAVDPGARLAETGVACLVALDLRERAMALLQFTIRRFALPALLLVCSALLVNSAVGVWNSWRQTEALMASAQRGKAEAAAQRIASFLGELEHQLGWVAYPQFATRTVEQRRYDYVRLLRQVPAITLLAQIDNEGREQLAVSRLAVDVVGSGADRSGEPAFTATKARRLYIGPLYFRKASEPYLTMALSHGGWPGGVTIAEVNLKPVWDTINGMAMDDGGHAYVVDGKGRLVAYRDIKLVLGQPDLTGQPQVAAALAGPSVDLVEGRSFAPQGLATSVLSTSAAVPGLDWKVIVDMPATAYQAPSRNAVIRAAALAGLGLAAAALAIMLALRPLNPARPAQA